MSSNQARHPAADFLQGYVDRLVDLWRERAKVSRDLKDARKANPAGVPALQKEIRSIDADIRKVRAEAAQQGFAVKAIEIVARESIETEAQRRKREELEIVVDLYRKALGLGGRKLV
ncbi:hypothetical protein BB934_45715 (plasmid) [Microvirga ossetica]|uniref:GapR-like DNA-binding domain-containing protein n=1 Tax=Microvirga ossetica TaxID=1882682 RepID=A0A1B2EZU6_9HYPH|nr:GapR family DNA-binding domain-containing protein [Microvirga ossetica]ANY85519.1 hypothetical protein BB934_45715 [Microvirga ossetica]